MAYFNDIAPIKYEGTKTKNMFAFRHYNPEEVVGENNGRTASFRPCFLAYNYDGRG